MDIGKRITFFRTAKGYTTNKLSVAAGLSQSFVRDLELGNKKPTIETLSYICDALDISLKDFFDEEYDSQFSTDPLLQKIYQLNQEQRNALLEFLNTMLK